VRASRRKRGWVLDPLDLGTDCHHNRIYIDHLARGPTHAHSHVDRMGQQRNLRVRALPMGALVRTLVNMASGPRRGQPNRPRSTPAPTRTSDETELRAAEVLNLAVLAVGSRCWPPASILIGSNRSGYSGRFKRCASRVICREWPGQRDPRGRSARRWQRRQARNHTRVVSPSAEIQS
jgi:hypothetical protein